MNTTESNMRITVNGQDVSIALGTTIAGLLDQLGITHPAIAVELNEQIQPKTRFEEQILSPDDRIEIVSLVGGG